MKRIAIFASGSGSNAQNIAEYFEEKELAEVSLILANTPKAYVLERAKELEIPAYFFDRKNFYHSDEILEIIKEHKIDYIVLAGFLWLFPHNIIQAFPNKVINIHPALLPNYGGRGMYGMKVHNAIVANKETESGITIHYVNEAYDEGQIIFQAKCELLPTDTADDLANKIHDLEFKHFPEVIENLLTAEGTF